ncbi:MAG: L-serine ammonia-lyase, iron-sulfur-dependent subunit beta [Planctomycetota bacterium]|jgi:L-serine dehydratase|nr:L-serine ammonia-lyase, iron-sulfur-dependent subunit beta [Planctomycetota bacterium]
MDIFDIIGPIMIGPSSSHTAGAVRIGKVCRKILGEKPVRAEIAMAGSFARTYKGHGTDKAIIAGILGMGPGDERVRRSLEIAADEGLDYAFTEVRLPRAHPNTAVIHLVDGHGAECTVQGASVGGGNILITKLNQIDTDFSGRHDTLIIPHKDVPGTIAAVTALVADSHKNIGNFRLSRPTRGYQAVMTIEIDGTMEPDLVSKLKQLPNVINVVYLPAN